ncbi:hypothetical protein FACS1894204_01020 [Synergistales bacterium]|nr:hypothetical protein FACS1894204_01020 [Synergistales bacterium]
MKKFISLFSVFALAILLTMSSVHMAHAAGAWVLVGKDVVSLGSKRDVVIGFGTGTIEGDISENKFSYRNNLKIDDDMSVYTVKQAEERGEITWEEPPEVVGPGQSGVSIPFEWIISTKTNLERNDGNVDFQTNNTLVKGRLDWWQDTNVGLVSDNYGGTESNYGSYLQVLLGPGQAKVGTCTDKLVVTSWKAPLEDGDRSLLILSINETWGVKWTYEWRTNEPTLSISPSSASIQVGGTVTLTPNVTPAGTELTGSYDWKYEGTSGAVTLDASAPGSSLYVKGLKAGSGSINVTVSTAAGKQLSASVPITVTSSSSDSGDGGGGGCSTGAFGLAAFALAALVVARKK